MAESVDGLPFLTPCGELFPAHSECAYVGGRTWTGPTPVRDAQLRKAPRELIERKASGRPQFMCLRITLAIFDSALHNDQVGVHPESGSFR